MVRLPVNEIFRSIQGEGVLAGYSAIFIRLAGCNLECPWCDTDHDSDVTHRTIPEIVKNVLNLCSPRPPVMVVVTGGEPTIHDLKLLDLVNGLRAILPEKAVKICLETNGTHPDSELFKQCFDWVVVSPKFGIDPKAFEYLLEPGWVGHELKVVMDGGIPLDTLKSLPLMLRDRFNIFSIQPLSRDYGPAVDFVKENPEWRLSIQLHKVIGVE